MGVIGAIRHASIASLIAVMSIVIGIILGSMLLKYNIKTGRKNSITYVVHYSTTVRDTVCITSSNTYRLVSNRGSNCLYEDGVLASYIIIQTSAPIQILNYTQNEK